MLSLARQIFMPLHLALKFFLFSFESIQTKFFTYAVAGAVSTYSAAKS